MNSLQVLRLSQSTPGSVSEEFPIDEMKTKPTINSRFKMFFLVPEDGCRDHIDFYKAMNVRGMCVLYTANGVIVCYLQPITVAEREKFIDEPANVYPQNKLLIYVSFYSWKIATLLLILSSQFAPFQPNIR